MRKLILFMLIFPINSFALTGKKEVSVHPSIHKDFKGFLWNHVDETIGEGSSPQLSEKDVMDAIREEFTDSKVAVDQLEKLKGPGGKFFFDYGYVEPEEYPTEQDDKNEGNLTHRCGVADEKNEKYNSYMESGTGPILISGQEIKHLPRYASEGKFNHLKWASKDQMKRHIARCFSRLPGMPTMKPRDPQGKTEMYFDDALYDDFYKWFATVPGLAVGAPGNAKVKNAAQCLLSSAMVKNPDRSGNVLVIQKAKNKKDSPVNTETFISEVDNLPMYSDAKESRGSNSHVYSLAFMDPQSYGGLKSKWEKDEIQTQGIWPNYQGGSLASLMGQTLGDQLHVNMKACFLSAGMFFPNADDVLRTINNPYECRDVDAASIPPEQQLDYYCEKGQGMSCFYLGAAYQQGKKFICLPKDMGGKCFITEGKPDPKKAREYYQKTCELGTPHGCYALGSMLDSSDPSFSSFNDEAITFYQKGCKLQEVDRCYYYNKGLSHVEESNLSLYQNSCKGSFIENKKSCLALGLYYLKKGDKQTGVEHLKKSCGMFGSKKSSNACLELARVHLKDGNKEEAKKILKKDCSFMEKSGCSDLYELSTEKEKEAMIKDICWSKKEKCF